jgi:hypothetical protein
MDFGKIQKVRYTVAEFAVKTNIHKMQDEYY